MPRVYFTADYNHILNPKTGASQLFKANKAYSVTTEVAERAVELGRGEVMPEPASAPQPPEKRVEDAGLGAFVRRKTGK